MNKSLKTLFLFLILASAVFSQSYEHLIIYGQSLSTGMQSWPPLSTTAVPNNYMIGSQVWINYGNTSSTILSPLISNMAPDGHAAEPKTTASMMTCECPIVSVANHLQLKYGGGKKYIASSCGSAGMKIEELSKEYYNPTLYNNQFIKTITSAYNITKNVHCPALFWMQGEFNYSDLPIALSATDGLTSGGTFTGNKARYKSLLLTLKNNMQNDIITTYGQSDKPLFITYQTGKNYTKGKTMEIGMAQLEASNENDDIVCAGPVYNMPDRGGHLDPNGSRWYGEILAKVFYKIKVLGENFKPLQPLQISRTADPKTITVKFLVPVLPLVFETNLVPKFTDYGFQVYLNGTKVTLSSVAINGDCVDLTSATSLTGDVEIVYAGVASGISQGKGNLRDSDPYTATLNYIDLDKKVDNVFVYERDATATTLRSPIYEPKAADGTSIYDKPYPLFNFSVAFYYKLNAADQVYNVPNLTAGAAKVNVTSLNISPATVSVPVGQTASFSATLTPSNPTNTSILWSSSKPGIAYVINGVVTAVGPGETVITAKSVDQGFTASCTVTCAGITEQAYLNGTPAAINTNIQVENFNKGGEGIAYHDLTPGNIAGVCRTDVNVDIANCPEGGYMVNSTAAGEWLDYAVSIPTSKTYYLKVKYAALSTTKIHFEVNGVNVTGSVNLPATYTGTTLTFQSYCIPATLSSGVQDLRLVIELGDCNFNYFIVSETADVNPTPASYNYYVDLSATTSGDGKSWAKAFKTIAEAETATSINAEPDSIFVKGTSFNLSSNWTLKAEKYFFSCGGTEVSPANRPMNDNDGNGIVEPWEFKYPTVLTNTNIGNGPTLISSTVLDGLAIKHTATRTNTGFTTLLCPAGATAQNCVITGSNLTYTAFSSIQNGGCLAKVSGSLKNSLFEKNIINVSATVDLKFTPIIEANAVTTNDVNVSGCVIRNNTASFDYSAANANMTYLKGMALNFTTVNSTPIAFVNFSNCVVYNNEFSYTGNATYPVADRASVAGSLSFSNNTTNGRYINCTFANNKLTNMKSAMNVFSNASIYHFVYNNVFWNNQNKITSTGTTTNVGMSSSATQNANTVVSNNIQDCPTLGGWGTVLTYTNNLLDLSVLNTGAKAPLFKNPSTIIGNSAAGSVELADWRLNEGSYLIAKGAAVATTGIATDKAGNNFATTTNPAVGAYEFASISSTPSIQSMQGNFATLIDGSLVFNGVGLVRIYTLTGSCIKSISARFHEKITLPQGMYLVSLSDKAGTKVQKVVF